MLLLDGFAAMICHGAGAACAADARRNTSYAHTSQCCWIADDIDAPLLMPFDYFADARRHFLPIRYAVDIFLPPCLPLSSDAVVCYVCRRAIAGGVMRAPRATATLSAALD